MHGQLLGAELMDDVEVDLLNPYRSARSAGGAGNVPVAVVTERHDA